MSDGVKKPWLSKTILVNFVVAAAALGGWDFIGAWVAGNESTVLAIVSGLNILLRLITKDKISISA